MNSQTPMSARRCGNYLIEVFQFFVVSEQTENLAARSGIASAAAYNIICVCGKSLVFCQQCPALNCGLFGAHRRAFGRPAASVIFSTQYGGFRALPGIMRRLITRGKNPTTFFCRMSPRPDSENATFLNFHANFSRRQQ
jgi:hypothetical protein